MESSFALLFSHLSWACLFDFLITKQQTKMIILANVKALSHQKVKWKSLETEENEGRRKEGFTIL